VSTTSRRDGHLKSLALASPRSCALNDEAIVDKMHRLKMLWNHRQRSGVTSTMLLRSVLIP
jgi:hypothetical protein